MARSSGDEPPDAHRAPGGEQMVGALGAQSVRGREVTLHAARIERSDSGELVDDHLRLRLGDCARHRVRVEGIGHDRPRSQIPERVLLRRGPGHPDHLVATRHELRDELSAENACGAGYEDLHDCSSRLIWSWIIAIR
jgi:hypothetical protein